MTEPRPRKRWKLLIIVLLAVAALAGGAAFSQKAALRTWYLSYRFERSAPNERQAWADKLVEMGEAAAPRLIEYLRNDDTAVCEIARVSLERMLTDWGPDDPRSGQVAERFFDSQPSFSAAGQVAALQLLLDLLNTSHAEAPAKGRLIVAAALKDKSADQRILGIALAARPELNLMPAVVPLLHDPEAGVRRAAMLVLGPIREGRSGAESPLVSQDELLHWLHDPDPSVREVCLMSLQNRGLSEQAIRLGRTLTDPDPMERLKLLIDLPGRDEVDLAVWLKRLSNDPSSAVRAGAARVAAERGVDFADRLEQMSQNDPDGTVRKIAEHYRKLYP